MTSCATVRKGLKDFGMLLLQDQHLPSVVGLFCGRAVKSSWWGIPEGQEIFRCLDSLDSGTAVATRLINRKVTYVHRRLWAALVTVGAARQPWQVRALSAEASHLLARTTAGESPVAHGATARELQERLLVVAQEVHTATGRHEIRLEPWDRWAARMQVEPLSSADEARQELEAATLGMAAPVSALPWHGPASKKTKSAARKKQQEP